MNTPPKTDFQAPLSEAPWLKIPRKPRIPFKIASGREPFNSWINSESPTQPDFRLWLTYETPSEWIEAVRAGGRIGAHDVCSVHHIEWPYILNYNILNMGYFAEHGKWDDIDQTDGHHHYVYSLQRSLTPNQLVTVYNIYLKFFKRNHDELR